MTHSLSDSWFQKTLLQDVLLPVYAAHRRRLNDVYMNRNFGIVDFHFPEHAADEGSKANRAGEKEPLDGSQQGKKERRMEGREER